MIRLQRVTLLALHQYLGLGAELIASQHRGNKNLKYRLERGESLVEGVPARQPSALQIQISSKNLDFNHLDLIRTIPTVQKAKYNDA